jgi:polyphosphate kinase
LPTDQSSGLDDDGRFALTFNTKRWNALRAEMTDAGIVLVEPDQVTEADCAQLEAHFLEHIFPLLTPLAVDPAHPFPFIPNLGFSLALELQHPGEGTTLRALVRMPHRIDRFLPLPQGSAADGAMSPPAPSSRSRRARASVGS